MISNDLRFILKEKYNYTEGQIMDFEKNAIQDKPNNLPTDLQADIAKLADGAPVAFIIGYVDFLNTRINLDYRTLIPRTETEYWASLYIDKLKDISNLKVLDIFCGSGCIGIALAKNLTLKKIVFSDLADEAIKQTRENIILNKLDENTSEVYKGNIFDAIPNQKFDYIFANPPYVENIYQKMGDRGLAFEPSVALFGGDDGMSVIEKFIQELSLYITQDGICVMEFGDNQENKVKEILKQNNFIDFEFFKDQFGVYRWVEIRNKK